MKKCLDCNCKLSLFRRGPRCKKCQARYDAEQQRIEAERRRRLQEVVSATIANKALSPEDRDFLMSQPKQAHLELYNAAYSAWEADGELSEEELQALYSLQDALSLSNNEIGFNSRVRPYTYALEIRKNNTLPQVHLNIRGGAGVVLRKNEVMHFADGEVSQLKETRMVSLGYKGGSHGVSIPVPGLKGVRYRVGSHRGQMMKEERLVETSRGLVIVTNQRLLLHPLPGNKPLSIPLKKILSYHCYSNGIELYKEGREKGYFLQMADSGSIELAGLCLGFLLKHVE